MNNVEDEKEIQAKIDKQIKGLVPYFAWLLYSKEFGSMQARDKYASTPEGMAKLKKRFGETLMGMPDNWEDMKKDFVLKDGNTLKRFLKTLLDIYGAIAGGSL